MSPVYPKKGIPNPDPASPSAGLRSKTLFDSELPCKALLVVHWLHYMPTSCLISHWDFSNSVFQLLDLVLPFK